MDESVFFFFFRTRDTLMLLRIIWVEKSFFPSQKFRYWPRTNKRLRSLFLNFSNNYNRNIIHSLLSRYLFLKIPKKFIIDIVKKSIYLNFCEEKKLPSTQIIKNKKTLKCLLFQKKKTLSIGRNVRFEKPSSFPEGARAQRARVASLILAGESVSRERISKPDNYSSGFFERSAAGLVGLRPALGPKQPRPVRARARVYTLAMQQP